MNFKKTCLVAFFGHTDATGTTNVVEVTPVFLQCRLIIVQAQIPAPLNFWAKVATVQTLEMKSSPFTI